MYWSILLGIATGMRTMTALAVLSWAIHLRYLPVDNPHLSWLGSIFSVIIFTLCALGEYVGDTLPQTPSRKKLPLMLGRLAMGIFIGCLCASMIMQPLTGGVILGGVGALIGTYWGYRFRMAGARLFGRDLPMAILEDLVAIGLCLFALERLHEDLISIIRHYGM